MACHSFLIIMCYPLYFLYWIITKTIVTIFQPHFYNLAMKKYQKKADAFNKAYIEYRKKGIFIDFPPDRPTYGTYRGIGPWGKKDQTIIFRDGLEI